MKQAQKIFLIAGVAILLLLGAAPALSPVQAQTPTGSGVPGPMVNGTQIPMLAYYYIWFTPTSWDRAKIDYPILGKYSSGDPQVIRQHILWAKEAGIQGFIVSWKSTDALNPRLEELIKIAGEENFKLVIIYQGLDFSRKPLPVSQVAADLDTFIAKYASNPVFDLFGKPLVIWSGTWEYSETDIASVTKTRRDKLLILASEKNQKGYERLMDLVDGDAYYWSSVNPDTFKDYAQKLSDMGKVVHSRHGIWIAPAAAGFDARLIGGTTTVDRKNGDTLRTEVDVALQSNPDAIGIISWNEFSENSHIEPSQSYGMTYLNVLASLNRAPTPPVTEFDSSDPGEMVISEVPGIKWVALGGMVFLLIACLGILVWRQR